MFQGMRNKFTAAALIGTALAVSAGSASAAIDVTEVVAAIDGTVATVGLIGAAVLLVLVAIKTYKWVTRAM